MKSDQIRRIFVEGPQAPIPYYRLWRGNMTGDELAKVALPEAGTRRQAVEAFVEWTRTVQTPGDPAIPTLEWKLCSCRAPEIEGGQRRFDCPWCVLRKAFGLLEDG